MHFVERNKERRRYGFKHKVICRNRAVTIAAAAPQRDETHEWYQIENAQRAQAGGAMRARFEQGLAARQTMNAHIQETAACGAEEKKQGCHDIII